MQALSNADLDVIEPQATVDVLQQLENLGDDVVIQRTESLIWEHLDFNFREGSLFADNPELREAFALCVPRQLIVDNLIKPLNDDAVVMNAREVFPFQEDYDDHVEAIYDGRFDETDIDEASRLVEESGADDLTVRIGYQSPNPRRSETVQLIKASCDEAGFNVEDAGAEDFFTGPLDNGDYEVALFAWSGSGQKASGRNIYQSEGGQNFGQYNNPEVDALWDELAASLDEDVHREKRAEIEKILWDDLFNIPLYASPSVSANRSDVANVRITSTQSSIPWNAEQWVRVSGENQAE